MVSINFNNILNLVLGLKSFYIQFLVIWSLDNVLGYYYMSALKID